MAYGKRCGGINLSVLESLVNTPLFSVSIYDVY